MGFSTALIFLVIVLDILVYYLRKQQEEDDDEQKNSSMSSPIDQGSVNEEEYGQRKDPSMSSPIDQGSVHEEEYSQRKDSSSSPDNQCRRFSLAEIKLATNDFDDAFVIGKGGFGNVYKGKIDSGEEIEVAIKRLNLDTNQGATEFRAEIEMLSKFRHSHIVSLLGYHEGSDNREMLLVYEYMSNGSLDDHLHKSRANGSNSSLLTWVQRLHICIGTARGLDYLHTGTSVQSRVIHRDVKSSNILLDENLAAKISDFGLSRIGPANQSSTTNVYTDLIKGTFGYMDAEYFATHRLTRKSDVYAFGVVLLEVLCGRPALDFTLDEEQYSLAIWASDCIREGNIDRIIDPCLRGQTRTKFLKEFGRIACECLSARSKDRPTMSKVVARLEIVLAWTLQSRLSAPDQKHIGRSINIEKAWSFLFIKAPKGHMSSLTKKLGQSINKEQKGIMMEKHATTMVEEGHMSSLTKKLGQSINTEQIGIMMEKHATTIVEEGHMSSLTKKLGQSINKEQKGIMMEKHATTMVEDGCHSGGIATTSEKVLPPTMHTKIPILKMFTFSELQSTTRNFGWDMFLGGRVYKGWLDSVTYVPGKAGDGLAVAIKRSRLNNFESLDEFQQKVEFLQRSSHPNIVKFIGFYWEKSKSLIVYEYMQKGSLGSHLFKNGQEPLAWDTRMKIAMGAAQGLAFLHTSKTSVMGFKSSNILLDGEFNAKLMDFGPGFRDEIYFEADPSSYEGPEYRGAGPLSFKSDVYGFGVVMLEMITGLCADDYDRPPSQRNLVNWAMPSLTNIKKLQRIMDPRFQRSYPLQGAMKLANLIQYCLQYNQKRRPSMKQVVAQLEQINTIKIEPEKLSTIIEEPDEPAATQT